MEVELISPSTTCEDTGRQKDIYKQVFSTHDYFIYNSFAPDSLRGWHLVGQGYEDLSKSDRGWLWCESLGLWLGTWSGKIQREMAIWLRFFDCDGNLVRLPEEVAQIEAQPNAPKQLKAKGINSESV